MRLPIQAHLAGLARVIANRRDLSIETCDEGSFHASLVINEETAPPPHDRKPVLFFELASEKRPKVWPAVRKVATA